MLPSSSYHVATQPNDATHGSQFFNGGMSLPSASDEPFQQMDIRLIIRQVSGFGFRIIGGREKGTQATVGHIVSGGAADGRLQVIILFVFSASLLMHVYMSCFN